MRRTREITIIHYRRSVRRNAATTAESCPVCGSRELLPVARAVRLTGISAEALYEWIAAGRVEATEAAGQVLICCRSLLEQIASTALEIGEAPNG